MWYLKTKIILLEFEHPCYRMSGPEASENAAVSKGEQEIIIDNVPGRIIVNALASGTGKRILWSRSVSPELEL